MNTLNKVLDKAREVCVSDAAIARRLKVTPSAVSLWRSGGKIKPEHLAILLDLAHQDPALAVQVMAEQEATPEERRMWGVVWDRLSPVTTVIGVALMLGTLMPLPAKAEPQALCTLCAVLRRRLAAAFTHMTARFTHGPSAVLA